MPNRILSIVAVYNRTISKVDEFLNSPAQGTRVIGRHSLDELAAALRRPRKVMLMVKAGRAGGVLGRFSHIRFF